MIERLIIRNFQSHKKSVLDFVQGLNIIVGTTDSGKTAILRALRWVNENRPTGDAYRSSWGGDTVVSVITSEGSKVTRKKTDRTNEYIINNDKKLKAFGTSVPQEVVDCLLLSSINVQQQMDSPFLLSDSSGEVAAHFNRIANIDVIDKSLARAKSEQTKTKQLIKQKKTEIEDKQEKLKQFDNLEQMETDLGELTRMIAIRDIKRTKWVEIDKLTAFMEENERNIKEIKAFLKIEPMVAAIKSQMEKLAALEERKAHVEMLADEVEKIGEELEETALLIALEPTVNSLYKMYAQKEQKEAHRGSIRRWLNTHQENAKKIASMGIFIASIQKQLDSIDICPLCGTKLHPKNK